MDKIVRVQIIDVGGYNKGVETTMNVLLAEQLAKEKKVIILEKFPGESDKKAPESDRKGGKYK